MAVSIPGPLRSSFRTTLGQKHNQGAVRNSDNKLVSDAVVRLEQEVWRRREKTDKEGIPFSALES
jgi:hypothetical protein